MKITYGLLSAVAFCFASSGAFAATTFGTLPGATFGGSGISNQNVTVTTIQDGSRTLTLGLTVTPRYSNPAVANTGLDSNNAGTFYAIVGGDVANGKSTYAQWNIGYYFDVPANAGYSVSFLYDAKNPNLGDTPSSSVNGLVMAFNGKQNSVNLGMSSYFGSGFNPNAQGEYSFALVVKKNGTELGRSSINVNVNATGTAPVQAPAKVPDAGTSLALLGVSLSAIFGIKRKLKQG
ncbi:MAG: VPDSG-CTERM sorting domain-containing protein [Verrucomicrobiaceae bacterium]|nr:MAG: VPDSG-CTERM sorting domain-containing protein [Verrucomicrobiaceae bacterium]